MNEVSTDLNADAFVVESDATDHAKVGEGVRIEGRATFRVYVHTEEKAKHLVALGEAAGNKRTYRRIPIKEVREDARESMIAARKRARARAGLEV